MIKVLTERHKGHKVDSSATDSREKTSHNEGDRLRDKKQRGKQRHPVTHTYTRTQRKADAQTQMNANRKAKRSEGVSCNASQS